MASLDRQVFLDQQVFLDDWEIKGLKVILDQ
jgi:hypothetical protein